MQPSVIRTGRPKAGPVSAARLSSVRLPEIDPLAAPWPLTTEVVDGRGLGVRRTPPTAPDRPPALYVHGLGGSATNWTDLAALLAGRLDAEAVDLPGFGASDPAADGDYSPRAHAAVLVKFLEQRGRGPVHLLGNSLGGVVSVLVAADRPDLVRTLTLISPAMPDLRPRRGPAPLLSAFAVPGVRQLANRYVDRIGTEARVRGVIEACFADPTLIPAPRLVETIAEAKQHELLPWASKAFADSV
ncbi:MAG TPA: alpha/beta fold hydrolase, partial [Mycobacteriales bacterium]|nr:alpha/beta fold hydrolase [Mycobacteriales bacterium]